MAKQILASSQITIIDLNDQISLSSNLTSTVPQIQLISKDGIHLPDWSESPVVVSAELYKIGYSSENIISTSKSVKAVRWYYKMITLSEYSVITGNTDGFELIGNGIHSQIKINKNKLTINDPGMIIKCEIDYQEEWMDSIYVQKSEMPFSASIQGEDGNAGTSSYSVILTNENQSIVCNEKGDPIQGQLGEEGRGLTKVIVYKGTLPLKPVSSKQYLREGEFYVEVDGSVVGGGDFKRVTGSNDEFYLDGKIGDSGYAMLKITFESQTGITASKMFSYNKTKPGASGAPAKAINLNSTGNTFVTDKNGTISPNSFLLTAEVQGLSYPYDVKWRRKLNDGNFEIIPNPPNELLREISNKDVPRGASCSYQVMINKDGVQYTDTMSFINVAEGEDSYTAILTNESHIIACDEQGNAFDGEIGATGKAMCQIVAYKGATKLFATSAQDIPADSFRYRIIAANGCIAERLNDEAFYIKTLSKDVDSGNVEIDILYHGNKSVKRIMTFTKSKKAINAMLLDITGESYFKENTGGALVPSSLTLTATVQGINNPIVQWQTYVNEKWTDLNTGNTVSISPSSSITPGWSNNILKVKAYVKGWTNVFDTYTITRVRDGMDTISLDVWAPNGTIINNANSEKLPVEAIVYEGVNNITTSSSVNYRWVGIEPNGTEQEIRTWVTGSNKGYQIDISNTQIPNMLPVKCYAQYKNKTYNKTIVLEDKNDPIQVEVISLNGEIFKNNQGETYIYARLIRSGEELDIIDIHESVPSTANYNNGDVIYVKSDKKYRQLINKAWSVLSSPPSILNNNSNFNYEWTMHNSNGVPSPFGTGKIIYLTHSQVNDFANFVVSVTQEDSFKSISEVLEDE